MSRRSFGRPSCGTGGAARAATYRLIEGFTPRIAARRHPSPGSQVFSRSFFVTCPPTIGERGRAVPCVILPFLPVSGRPSGTAAFIADLDGAVAIPPSTVASSADRPIAFPRSERKRGFIHEEISPGTLTGLQASR